jgi:molybdenum cofactor cytidylyltransferase
VASVSAILLAAGESTRMGRQKALLPWDGTTLIEYQLAQLGAVEDVREIIVVMGHEPQRILKATLAAGARTVHNANYRSGKVSSIQAGVAAVATEADAILLIAVDQPRHASVVRRIIEAHVMRGALITVPTYEGRRGHPVIFRAALRGELDAIHEDTLGVRAVIERHTDDVVTVEITDPAVRLDLNSPDDLAAAPRRAPPPPP